MIDNDYREVDTDEKDEAVSEKNETTETPVETGEVVTDDHAEEHENPMILTSSVQCADVRQAKLVN